MMVGIIVGTGILSLTIHQSNFIDNSEENL